MPPFVSARFLGFPETCFRPNPIVTEEKSWTRNETTIWLMGFSIPYLASKLLFLKLPYGNWYHTVSRSLDHCWPWDGLGKEYWLLLTINVLIFVSFTSSNPHPNDSSCWAHSGLWSLKSWDQMLLNAVNSSHVCLALTSYLLNNHQKRNQKKDLPIRNSHNLCLRLINDGTPRKDVKDGFK